MLNEESVVDDNLNPTVRYNCGFTMGKQHAQEIFESLLKGETIKFVTHSMGAAYTKGFIKGLEHYAINHHIDYKNIIELEIDLAPFQPNCQRAINYVRTIVIAHKYDWVAKHRPMKGTIYNYVTHTDRSYKYRKQHTINSFSENEIFQFVDDGVLNQGGLWRVWEENGKNKQK